ncbi:hypothetical protein COCON_G00121810 [Conger conger]|uniref:Uncharacterized protein n=1 Tax=Conger conger TaxID=82655 RepID=A0A9Q1HZ17_CONCO|nr:hypothetical protein COCON_G00121810 [Conger conger]
MCDKAGRDTSGERVAPSRTRNSRPDGILQLLLLTQGRLPVAPTTEFRSHASNSPPRHSRNGPVAVEKAGVQPDAIDLERIWGSEDHLLGPSAHSGTSLRILLGTSRPAPWERTDRCPQCGNGDAQNYSEESAPQVYSNDLSVFLYPSLTPGRRGSEAGDGGQWRKEKRRLPIDKA